MTDSELRVFLFGLFLITLEFSAKMLENRPPIIGGVLWEIYFLAFRPEMPIQHTIWGQTKFKLPKYPQSGSKAMSVERKKSESQFITMVCTYNNSVLKAPLGTDSKAVRS